MENIKHLSASTSRLIKAQGCHFFYYSSFLVWRKIPQGIFLWVFLLFYVSTLSLEAQNAPKTLEQVLVYGHKSVKESAISKTTIDTTVLRESANSSFAELLSRHSSIYVKSYGQGSLATVSFRGTSASHTQVEWNGLNINNPMLGQVDFSMIPVSLVDRTEIFYGGSSLQNGSGALGGAINIGSAPMWGQSLYGAISQGLGSFGTYESFVSVGGGTDKFQARFRYLYQQSENDFSYKNIAVPPFNYVRQTNAQTKKHGGVLDLYYKAPKENYFNLNIWYMHSNRNMPTIMSYQGLGREEYQMDNELRVVGKWSKFWGKAKSELLVGFTNTDLKYFLANMTDFGPFVQNDSYNSVLSYTAKYGFEYNLSERTTFKAQVDAYYHSIEIRDRRRDTENKAYRFQSGLSASVHHSFGDKWSGYALLREDFVDGKFTSVMPSLGVQYKPMSKQDIIVKLNASRNYHQPTLNDLYWIPGGNPDLKAEQGFSADVAVEYSKKLKNFSIQGRATGYASMIDDWIMWRPSEFSYWTAENLKEVFSRGAELYAQGVYIHHSLQLKLSGNYSYTRTSDQSDNLKSKQLIYIPIHKANAMFEGQFGGWYMYYVWTLVGERFTSDTNAQTRHILPTYNLHDTTIGKKFTLKKINIDANLKVNNIFNKRYQAILWRAMPQRNVMCTVKLSYSK